MTKPTVFISYSHLDEEWKDRIVTHLKVLHQEFDVWDDSRIGGGDDWYPEIETAMNRANVAVFLVSADFLTSKFILSKEVPLLLERREKEGLHIFPIIIRPCAWDDIEWLARMQARPKGEALSGGNDHDIETKLVAITKEIKSKIGRTIQEEKGTDIILLPPEKISLAKLPSTSSTLFGREKELKDLDAAWNDSKTNIVTLVAWGGVGKTSLVNAWRNQMLDDNFRGAERVFGWSFYSQGASEDKQVSADVFIASALKWFGDPEPDKGAPWEKGERLADFFKKQKTLLILDGLEPLQNPPGEGGGRIKDPGIQSLLRELANYNPGLCVITTRLEVDDIKDFIGNSAQSISLDNLSPDAGKQLLEHLGVKGTSEQLKEASREFGYHALALTLLGSYLTVVFDGDIRKRNLIEKLTDDEENGGHAKRVMESYEKWFKGKPELNVLYILGVFGRPAEAGAIKVLMTKPVINGLTSYFKKFSYKNWRIALNHMKKAGLLTNEDDEPDKLDCHPFIREYFGEKLKESNPVAWKEAHTRLYEYYKKTKELPDTIEEMVNLYQAVAHGCEAGRHQEALAEVYKRRIQRGNEYFNQNKLGAFGANLALLSGFFDSFWDKPLSEFSDADKAYILADAGFCLRALGRLADAAQPIHAALDATMAQGDWKNTAQAAINLSELYLTLGNVPSAMDYSRQGVEYADKSDDAFMRIANRTVLADALHQAGQLAEAKAAFAEAEEMQKEYNPKYSYLYSIRGFHYCDLLLSQGKYLEVLGRAGHTLELLTKDPHAPLLTIVVDRISIGRAHMLQTQQEGKHDFAQAETHLNKAVEGLQRAGVQDYLVRGLLTRAELHRVSVAFPEAQHDLDEAITIAERGSMGLYMADCHLEYARLYLAMGEKEEDARKNLDSAKEMIEKMGYHRRDKDVQEIEEQLGKL